MSTRRDLEYIENRLLAPDVGALEAYERLQQIGYDEEATELMEALKEFNDKIREIRKKVNSRSYESYSRDF